MLSQARTSLHVLQCHPEQLQHGNTAASAAHLATLQPGPRHLQRLAGTALVLVEQNTAFRTSSTGFMPHSCIRACLNWGGNLIL